MPKDGERSREGDDEETQESRIHRSSSHHHHRHKHSGRHRESSREHRKHRPYRREKEPRSSTHIFFNGSDNTPSVSVHTDHVMLASNLSSLVDKNGDMLRMFEECCQMLERLRKDRATNSAIWQQSSTSTSSSSRHRGVNQSNLVTVPQAPAKESKPSFKEVMEQHKATNLVPAAQTKERLHRSLSSHSEAKLESIDISLFCPLTHSRMVTPVRGQYCNHIHCFDGEAFCNLMWQKPSPKWKCPICKGYTPLSQLVVDGFIMEILASVPENVKSVEFTSDGSWRIKENTLSSISTTSLNKTCDQGNNEVIDLTFDTPEKVIKERPSSSSGNCVPQVIDLTLSP